MQMNGVVLAVLLTVLASTCEGKLKYSGMTFTDDRYCPNITFDSPVAVDSMKHLASTGANFVSIVVTQYQLKVNSTEIFALSAPERCSATPGGFCMTASDTQVVAAINTAHRLGLGVMLKLQIDLTDEPTNGIWRGMIGMNMTERDWSLWFESYTRVISHYANIANQTGTEMLSVSCELITASAREKEWREVIRIIRAIYSGTLTDAANWNVPGCKENCEVSHKKWWDAVDVIGIDEYQVSYFNHTMNANGEYATLEQLLKIWEPIEQQMLALHQQWDKPIIFTEIGYCSGVNGSCFQNGQVRPSPATTPASMQAQATQYEAALTAMSKYTWWEGIFWWNWATDAAFGGSEVDNSCMDPKFKPAEDVLRKWYNATEPRPPKPTYPATCKCWL